MFVVVAAIVTGVAMSRTGDGQKMDEATATELAQCLSDKGAKMYGAKWCPHCQKQKEAFGAAADKLPYVECSDESAPNGQAKECADAGITGYPTWVFADGQRQSGEITMAELAAKAGCPFQDAVTTAPNQPAVTAPTNAAPVSPSPVPNEPNTVGF